MKFLGRHKILLYSLTLSTLIVLLFTSQFNLNLNWTDGAQNTPYEIMKLISSITGTILGFLLTAVAMLTAVMDRKLVENMRKTGHYRTFIVDCFINCFLFLLIIILSIFGLFLNPSELHNLFLIIINLSLTSVFMLISQGRRFLIIFTKI